MSKNYKKSFLLILTVFILSATSCSIHQLDEELNVENPEKNDTENSEDGTSDTDSGSNNGFAGSYDYNVGN